MERLLYASLRIKAPSTDMSTIPREKLSVWIEGFAYYILPSIQIDIGVRRARVWRRQKVMKNNILIYFDRLDTLNRLLRFIFVGRRGLAPLGGVETLINFMSKYNS